MTSTVGGFLSSANLQGVLCLHQAKGSKPLFLLHASIILISYMSFATVAEELRSIMVGKPHMTMHAAAAISCFPNGLDHYKLHFLRVWWTFSGIYSETKYTWSPFLQSKHLAPIQACNFSRGESFMFAA